MIGNGGSDMKRIIVICLCLAMLACGTTAQQEETAHTDTPVSAEPAENETIAMNLAPEPVRYPVREVIAALPEAIEPIDLEDHLLVYESNDATYLYAYGESVFLHQGGINSWDGPYNYLTEGTAFTFIEPGDGTLHIIDLNDPQKTPATVDSDAVNGVKRFAISQSGNEILFLKGESERDGESAEALYYFANGEAMRIEESVGEVDQFSLSPDGKSYVFYMMDEPYSEILTINGVPIDMDDHIEDLSEDFRTALTLGSGVLTLYREGTEPLVLSENSELYGCRIMSDGTVRWIETDNTYWEYRGTEKSKLAENAESPYMTESGMIEFFRGGSLYVQFGDDEPLLICAKRVSLEHSRRRKPDRLRHGFRRKGRRKRVYAPNGLCCDRGQKRRLRTEADFGRQLQGDPFPRRLYRCTDRGHHYLQTIFQREVRRRCGRSLE